MIPVVVVKAFEYLGAAWTGWRKGTARAKEEDDANHPPPDAWSSKTVSHVQDQIKKATSYKIQPSIVATLPPKDLHPLDTGHLTFKCCVCRKPLTTSEAYIPFDGIPEPGGPFCEDCFRVERAKYDMERHLKKESKKNPINKTEDEPDKENDDG